MLGQQQGGNLMPDRRQSWTPLDAGCVYIVVLSMGRLPATGVLLPIAASLNEAIGCTCISLPGLCRRSTCQGLQVEWSMPNCFMMVLRYICRAMGTMIHSRSPYLFSALKCSCLFWSYFSGRAHGLKENLLLLRFQSSMMLGLREEYENRARQVFPDSSRDFRRNPIHCTVLQFYSARPDLHFL